MSDKKLKSDKNTRVVKGLIDNVQKYARNPTWNFILDWFRHVYLPPHRQEHFLYF